MIEELVHQHEEALNPVLDSLGDKNSLTWFLKHCAQSCV